MYYFDLKRLFPEKKNIIHIIFSKILLKMFGFVFFYFNYSSSVNSKFYRASFIYRIFSLCNKYMDIIYLELNILKG